MVLPNNVILVIFDDVGPEWVQAYAAITGVGSVVTPPTPYPNTININALVQKGVLFKQAWAHPLCSPTRVTLQTGEYP